VDERSPASGTAGAADERPRGGDGRAWLRWAERAQERAEERRRWADEAIARADVLRRDSAERLEVLRELRRLFSTDLFAKPARRG
jgi:hypothetical protein